MSAYRRLSAHLARNAMVDSNLDTGEVNWTGSRLTLQPLDWPCEIRIGARRHDLGLRLARAMRVERPAN